MLRTIISRSLKSFDLVCNQSYRRFDLNFNRTSYSRLITSRRSYFIEINSNLLKPIYKLNLPSSVGCQFNLKMSSGMPFFIDYDKRGKAKCKRCKGTLEKGELRIAKLGHNPFSDSGGDMKFWHHVDCIFESFKKARATTKKIEDPIDDIDGWGEIEEEDQKRVKDKIEEFLNSSGSTPAKSTPKKPAAKTPTPKKTTQTASSDKKPSYSKSSDLTSTNKTGHKDDAFKEFRRLCALVADNSSYLAKTEKVSNFFKKGTSGDKFEGDLRLWVKLLLPGVIKRVYNLQSKQIVKLFSVLFDTNQDEMLEDLEQGDVAETIRIFFEKSDKLPPIKKSDLTIHDIDKYLQELSQETKEEEQSYILKKICKRCTGNDLKMVIRLIKGDLRINAGAKHILDAVHPDAYAAFQTTRNIDSVLDQIMEAKSSGNSQDALKIQANVMTPILPMLAEACKSVEYAMKKCPHGMFSEIKYDGERVQVHKKGNNFEYYSRSLKPVLPHKVSHFKDYIPQAFPHGNDLILDAEVLLIDQKTGNPLPFGTLGKHKKSAFEDANVCLFIFDCIHYNGENLMDKPIDERKKILDKNMTEIKNRIMFSEMKLINKAADLQDMITKVLSQGLEGLVLKDVKSLYEPGKRHWLKVKKDYLHGGAMADTADLVVLGAWYGTGKKGGMMSVFLMGCYDPIKKRWCSVTKVHTGHDDATLEKLQTTLDMVKINQEYDNVPSWLHINKPLTPDLICQDPKKSPVWEITGAEFTQNKVHTANGISIRFPRVTKIRNDKDWQTATNLQELEVLLKNSKDFTQVSSAMDEQNSKSSSSPKSNRSSPDRSTDNSNSSKTSKKIKSDSNSKTMDDFVQKSPRKEIKNDSKKEIKNESRKRSSDDDISSSKKKMCKYGADCYNKDKEHALKYEHKVKDEHPTINPLLDIFSGIKLYIPDKLKDSEKLERYFIAYDGEILNDFEKDESSYTIVSKDIKSDSTSSQKVDVSWLWDSIKLKKLQNVKLYLK